MKKNKLGLYIHIPFCIKKCRYCDFVSGPAEGSAREEYLEVLGAEIKDAGLLFADKYEVDTVFFGGGTPTTLSGEQLKALLCRIRDTFEGSFEEISCEANPGTIDDKKLKDLKAAGFTRLSIGVQSFDDGVLKQLGRIHSASEAEKAVKSALDAGFETNLDLMLGVPGQSLKSWENSLERAIELRTHHLSFYSLQLEEGTPLYQDYRFGKLVLPTWEENRAMYHTAVRRIKQAGYHHYEISNAAKPGYECRHNLKYWTMAEYLGLGRSAYSYIDGKRFGSYPIGKSYKAQIKPQSAFDAKSDFIFTALRLIDGFEDSSYFKLFGVSFFGEFKEIYDKLVIDEMLECEGGRIKFTEKGLDHTNEIMAELIAAIKQ
jgi:oxygen-independent coproporphyrinogen-3 oxidase